MNYRLLNDLVFQHFIRQIQDTKDLDRKVVERAKTNALRSWMDLIQRYSAEHIEAAVNFVTPKANEVSM